MSGLTPKQLGAVAEIAKGRTPSAISKDIAVSERTIQRWLKLPEFKAALAEIRTKTQVKLTEGISQEISGGVNIDMRQLQREHIQLYSRFRKLAELCLAHYEGQLKQSPEDFNFKQLSILMQTVDRCIRGEADSAFFHYLDLDAAIRAVVGAGYKIYDETQQPREEVSSLDLN